ncbi:MAG: beta-galactosidase [Acidobacteriia bacterium]|nr:beta-galactosidase [Terriglobia bacterium]
MDVNQTRFHLVYGEAGWLPAQGALDWNNSDATFTLHKELFLFPRPPGEALLDIRNRRGSGRDRYGNFYWIGPGQDEIRFLGISEKTSEHFWSSADAAPANKANTAGDFFSPVNPPAPAVIMSGLTVTTEHYLVVGLTSPPGLLIFDLYGGGPPLQYHWPAGVDFAPFDIAASPDGGVYVLDRDHRSYWYLDRYFRVSAEISGSANPAANDSFRPATGQLQPGQMQCVSRQITATLAIPLTGLSSPEAIEALPDGTVIILDNPPAAGSPPRLFSVLYHYRFGVQVSSPQKLDQALAPYLPPEQVAAAALRGYDIAFVANQSGSAEMPGNLFVVGIDGEQVFEFAVKLQQAAWLEITRRYLPMRRFGGKALAAGSGNVYYDFEDRWAQLAEQERARYAPQATFILPASGPSSTEPPAFDGRDLGCVWHRILMEACIPPGAQIAVESRAADQTSLLPAAPWQPEPLPYLRSDGAELAFYRTPLSGQPDHAGTWELLFQNARGRYLQLQVTFTGTGRNTPRLHALRAYYPRFSYLRQYLPAVYRDDALSASFLDRYLANVEGFYTVLEGRIEQVQALFDVRTVPAEYLDWLGNWLALALDMGWSEQTRRLVISHGPQMFRERGTRAGMIRAIRLALDPCPDESLFQESSCAYNCPGAPAQSPFTVRVVERFITRNAPGVVYGDPTDVAGPGSTTTSLEWTPAQGADLLHERFRNYLRTLYSSIEDLNVAWAASWAGFDEITLPPVEPAQKMQSADWQRFLRSALGFTYAAVTLADRTAYQRFLARLYPHVSDLNRAYDLTLGGFDSVTLPDVFPSSGRKLQDWIQFVSVVLPTARNAHRFTVLVPVTLGDGTATQLTRLGVAQRVAELEKPAHTAFDVRPYWGMFRVGEARVGLDTLLGHGTRSVALVLGRDYLAGGHLAFTEPWNVTDRMAIAGSMAARPCGSRPQERCT